MSHDLRIYELPQLQYQLAQEVGYRLGMQAQNALVCVLGGAVKKFYGMLPPDQEQIIRSMAAQKKVALPD